MSASKVDWFPIPGKEDLELPISQGAASGNLVIMTQVPQQADGTLNLGSAEEQARQCLQNFATELEKVGSGLDRVLSITIYLTDLEDFGAVTGVWGEFYPGRGPGRTTVGVADLHPAGLRVEMTAFAVRDA
ncbi:RidA family protein [Leucobacter celer]|uniref:RidA family protein n=1 Tax=Leucobacter celer TaxID=668625 RepID=UPI0006A7C15A|nr:RidA family protein [Leucobacter celer]